MTSPPLETLRTQLREIDRTILCALSARARFPRHPRPKWPEIETRLPPPPLTEILFALAPAGTADPAPDAANRGLTAALQARQRLALQIAEAKAEVNPADSRAAIETGDRDKLLALLTDLPAELRLLDFIRAAAAELAPNLPTGLAPLLWCEYVIPWTKQVEVAHLLEP
jgi:chorismate mutase